MTARGAALGVLEYVCVCLWPVNPFFLHSSSFLSLRMNGAFVYVFFVLYYLCLLRKNIIEYHSVLHVFLGSFECECCLLCFDNSMSLERHVGMVSLNDVKVTRSLLFLLVTWIRKMSELSFFFSFQLQKQNLLESIFLFH